MPTILTEEQSQVIHHPVGVHARVMAVAGSGKTTTLAHRIIHLIQQGLATPDQIQVLMYNRSIRMDFSRRISQLSLPPHRQPRINTFHSYALAIITQTESTPHARWYDGSIASLNLTRARRQACQDLQVEPEQIDIDLARDAIRAWKSELIPPARARWHGDDELETEALPRIYALFEERRLAENALTYDDFIPEAINILHNDPDLLQRCQQTRHLIVDEYQDIDQRQHTLIELIAQGGSDLMMVGDDDQTIYEWRGARANYILRDFEKTFTNKPQAIYRLTHSFRFGYTIAQAADNLIQHNQHRLAKSLIAHHIEQPSQIHCIPALPRHWLDEPDQAADPPTATIVTAIAQLMQQHSPRDIKVLARAWRPLLMLSMQLRLIQIPHQLEGYQDPLRDPVATLVRRYYEIIEHLDNTSNTSDDRTLRNVANRPFRRISGRDITDLTQHMRDQELTYRQALLSPEGQSLYSITEDLFALEPLFTQRRAEPGSAHLLLQTLDQQVNLSHFLQTDHGAEGAGPVSLALLQVYAEYTNLAYDDFAREMSNSDTTLGQPPDRTLGLTTIHQAKGLEWDHVVIADCLEGSLPQHRANRNSVQDSAVGNRPPTHSTWLENERRLFYVALTRARQQVIIGLATDDDDTTSRFIEELDLEPTQQLAKAIVNLGQDDPQALAMTARSWNNRHHILQQLQQSYAPLLPEEVADHLQQVQRSPRPKPAGYHEAYPFNIT